MPLGQIYDLIDCYKLSNGLSKEISEENDFIPVEMR